MAMDELDRDAALFDSSVPVRVEYNNREQRVMALTIRVLAGKKAPPSAGGHARDMLHMEITNPLDPYFLYTLQVTDEDFHDLKHDQSLLVDFGSFAPKFIELLECCQGHSADQQQPLALADHPAAPPRSPDMTPLKLSPTASPVSNSSPTGTTRRDNEDPTRQSQRAHGQQQQQQRSLEASPNFVAELSLVDRPVLRVVETNKFKHLTHLALRFQPGNDESIKAYLVSRLQQSDSHCHRLNHQLATTEANLNDTTSERDSAVSQLGALRQEYSSLQREMLAKHQEQIGELREQHARELAELQNNSSHDSRERQSQSESKINSLTEQVSVLQSDNRELADSRVRLEAQVKGLGDKLKRTEEQLEDATTELHSTRKENIELANCKYENEKELSKLQLRLTATSQQVLDKESLVQKTTQLLSAANEQRTNLDDKIKGYKHTIAKLSRKLELSISEIQRGNAVISKFQDKIRTMQERMNTKSLVIRRQEEKLEARTADMAALDSRVFELEQQAQSAQESLRKSNEERASVARKLEEANKTLDYNQNVIAYLNKEINHLQLGGSATLGSGAPVGGNGNAGNPAYAPRSTGAGWLASVEGFGVGVGAGRTEYSPGNKSGAGAYPTSTPLSSTYTTPAYTTPGASGGGVGGRRSGTTTSPAAAAAY